MRDQFHFQPEDVQTLRLSMGLSTTEFGKLSGVPRTRINEWEGGSKPIYPKYQKTLNTILDVYVDSLVSKDKDGIPRK